MTRKSTSLKHLLFIFLLPCTMFSQEGPLYTLTQKINALEAKVGEMESTGQALQKEVKSLEAQNARLEQTIQKLNGELASTKLRNKEALAQLTAQEQAWNERISILETNQGKLQNEVYASVNNLQSTDEVHQKSLSAVRSTLEGNYTYLLILLAIGLVLIPIVAISMSRMGVKKGLTSAQANWNKFQEYIIGKH